MTTRATKPRTEMVILVWIAILCSCTIVTGYVSPISGISTTPRFQDRFHTSSSISSTSVSLGVPAHHNGINAISKLQPSITTKTTIETFKRPKSTSGETTTTSLCASASSDLFRSDLQAATANARKKINKFKAAITKFGLMSYIISMCVALPITLFPAALLQKFKIISRQEREQLSVHIGQFCSRWLMRVFPFANIHVVQGKGEEEDKKKRSKGRFRFLRKKLTNTKTNESENEEGPEPSVWVCNHTSMLDIFVLLGIDKKLRGTNTRPIKIIYWKELEKNLVTRLLFKMSGFIAVEMEDNGNGNANEYKKSSFKALLKNIKQAFEEGFDIGILPEGQLNPNPEEGLLPVFPGAFTLAKMSRRPIRMMGLHGLHQLWHPNEDIGMTVTGRDVAVRAYPTGHKFTSGEEFVQAFKTVVGHFGSTGTDLPGWEDYLNGNAWKRKVEEKKEQDEALKKKEDERELETTTSKE